MKLPEDKKQRTQVFIFIGICVIGLGYLGHIAVQKMGSSREATKVRKEELEADITKWERQIAHMPKYEKAFEELAGKIKALEAKYVLKPKFTSHILPATELIEQAAAEFGIEVEVKDHGKPPPYGKKAQLLGYVARVNLTAGYNQLILLLEKLETDNPYLCITKINIMDGPEDQLHRMSFHVEWPVWAKKNPLKALKVTADRPKKDGNAK